MKLFLIQRKKKLMISVEATVDMIIVLLMDLTVLEVIQELKIQMVRQTIEILIQMISLATLTMIFLAICLEVVKNQNKGEKI